MLTSSREGQGVAMHWTVPLCCPIGCVQQGVRNGQWWEHEGMLRFAAVRGHCFATLTVACCMRTFPVADLWLEWIADETKHQRQQGGEDRGKIMGLFACGALLMAIHTTFISHPKHHVSSYCTF